MEKACKFDRGGRGQHGPAINYLSGTGWICDGCVDGYEGERADRAEDLRVARQLRLEEVE